MEPSSGGQELDVACGDGELVGLGPPYAEDGGELIKKGGGVEEPVGYPNYTLMDGAIERIEPGYNDIPQEKHILIPSPPCVFTEENLF
ncbi:hypothetical protein B9Z19DRAFT_1129223 [Tuber borchii]|uniref:Uncharacterized protein n=1 Tax=Tuber borchii TaxID=42251 RepID=A0A2T6ZMT0_TUBBO|nr:hypothetical protein B9Z19DRAFT_1129223 [Tuber borchii]